MCVGHVCVCAHMDNVWNWFFSSAMWVLGTEPRSYSLVLHAFTCWAVLRVLNMI